MRNRSVKKVFSMLLALVMLVGLLPTAVFAEEPPTTLALGEEQPFAMEAGADAVSYTFTAETADTYIFYIKKDDPNASHDLDMGMPGGEFYNHRDRMIGYVIELQAGQTISPKLAPGEQELSGAMGVAQPGALIGFGPSRDLPDSGPDFCADLRQEEMETASLHGMCSGALPWKMKAL